MNRLLKKTICSCLGYAENCISKTRAILDTSDADNILNDGNAFRLVNLTGHDVVLYDDDGEKITLKTDGYAGIRDKVEDFDKIYVEGFGEVGIMKGYTGDLNGLPEPEDGVLFVVSRSVKTLVPDRSDCVVPYSVMRYNGKPYGCRMFAY